MPRLMAVSLLLCLLLAAMVQAWVWAIRKWRRGEGLLPPPKPRTVPWGLGSVLLVILTWLLVNIGVFTIYTIATAGAKAAPGRELSFAEQMLLVTLINGTLLLLVPPLLRATSGARLSDLGVTARDLSRHAWVGVVAFLLVSPAVYALNGLAVRVWKPNQHPLEKMVRGESSGGIAQLAILSAVLLAPAAEELIFRGVIQSWLRQAFSRRELEALAAVQDDPERPIGPAGPDSLLWDAGDPLNAPRPLESETSTPAATLPEPRPTRSRAAVAMPILITSLVFAAVHLPQWPAPLAIFFLSLGLGLVYERTGSLMSCFVMHALFNALGTLLLFATQMANNEAAEKAVPPPGCIGAKARQAATRAERRATIPPPVTHSARPAPPL